jgi:hypothetical protein
VVVQYSLADALRPVRWIALSVGCDPNFCVFIYLEDAVPIGQLHYRRDNSCHQPPVCRKLPIAALGGSHMKRFVILTVLFTFIAGAFAAMAPASADPHGDRFKADCKSGARKC